MKITVCFKKGGVALKEVTEDEDAPISNIWERLEEKLTLGWDSRLIYGRGEASTVIDQNDVRTLEEVISVLLGAFFSL